LLRAAHTEADSGNQDNADNDKYPARFTQFHFLPPNDKSSSGTISGFSF
jgi:hypothetical protein